MEYSSTATANMVPASTSAKTLTMPRMAGFNQIDRWTRGRKGSHVWLELRERTNGRLLDQERKHALLVRGVKPKRLRTNESRMTGR